MVIDSSTLILLAKAGLLDKVIDHAKTKMTIPQKVLDEATRKEGLADAQLIKRRVSDQTIDLRPVKDRQLYAKIVKDFNMGLGEAEALTLCLEHQGTLISDDKKAMNACKVFQVPFATAANLLVELHRTKHLSREETQAAIYSLGRFGRYSAEYIRKMKEDCR